MTRTNSASRRARTAGFTLIEITIVIAIAALVTAITLGGFNSISSSNKRVSCQTNLSQIYQALRLYANDYNGQMPYYNPSGLLPTSSNYYTGIGLWALYTFPCTGAGCTGNAGDELAPIVDTYPQTPVERYIHDVRILHCPADQDAPGTPAGDLHEPLYTTGSSQILNPLYLSYQGQDPAYASYPTPDDTVYERYQTTRTTSYPASSCTTLPCFCGMGPCWRHQLTPMTTSFFYQFRPPDPTTVITWCPYHRNSPASDTSPQFDNVLFYDGTVQLVMQNETNPSSTDTTLLTGAERVPNPTD